MLEATIRPSYEISPIQHVDLWLFPEPYIEQHISQGRHHLEFVKYILGKFTQVDSEDSRNFSRQLSNIQDLALDTTTSISHVHSYPHEFGSIWNLEEPVPFLLRLVKRFKMNIALEEEFESIPEFTMVGSDPRAMFDAEWRDKFRALYQFEKLKRNFLTLTFTWTENGEDENMDLLSTDWTKAQTLFQRLEQKDLSKIKFKTRELEENEVLREWSNVPSVL